MDITLIHKHILGNWIGADITKYHHQPGFGHMDNDDDSPHFKSTITFKKADRRTIVEMNLLFPTVEKRDEATKFGAMEGGHQTLARIA